MRLVIREQGEHESKDERSWRKQDAKWLKEVREGCDTMILAPFKSRYLVTLGPVFREINIGIQYT